MFTMTRGKLFSKNSATLHSPHQQFINLSVVSELIYTLFH